ncbi:hypothetical protein BH20ACT24_BH20ACT24_18740 [soil metagenome]
MREVVLDASVVLEWFAPPDEGRGAAAAELRRQFEAGDIVVHAARLRSTTPRPTPRSSNTGTARRGASCQAVVGRGHAHHEQHGRRATDGDHGELADGRSAGDARPALGRLGLVGARRRPPARRSDPARRRDGLGRNGVGGRIHRGRPGGPRHLRGTASRELMGGSADAERLRVQRVQCARRRSLGDVVGSRVEEPRLRLLPVQRTIRRRQLAHRANP